MNDRLAEKKLEHLKHKWKEIDDALKYGLYGLPGGSSLAGLLEECGMVDECVQTWVSMNNLRFN